MKTEYDSYLNKPKYKRGTENLTAPELLILYSSNVVHWIKFEICDYKIANL